MLVLRGATLIDGTGAPGRPDTDIAIEGARIVAIGSALPVPTGTAEVDVRGAWIVPGLIDTHVHLMHVPGQDWLGLGPAELDALGRRQLASYVAAGVTTVLDAGIAPDRLAQLRGYVDAGAVAPRILVLGQILGPSGGYPEVVSSVFRGVDTPDEVRSLLDGNVALGAIGTKVTFERGYAGQDWTLFDPAMRAAIREESAARSLPVFVHAMTPEEFLPALDLAPRAFLHGPEHSDRAMTAALAASGTPVVPTLTLYDAPLLAANRRALDEPWVAAVVPPELLAAGRDRATAVKSRRALAELAVPWAPGWLAGIGFSARMIARGRLHDAVAAARQLHEAGVPLILGTDSGTWPLIHTQFAGVAAVRELELLAEVGLTPEEVVVAGTRAPADLLGIRDEVGTVEVGKVADLIVLTADPLADPTAWRRVSWVVHDGVACSAVDPPRGRRLRSWGRMTLRSARATAARAP